uniref:Uncharacterized protein n=1 Tax=Panagrolaimus superbus TaxID=310955 RepID=A0A914Z0A8_9BILA
MEPNTYCRLRPMSSPASDTSTPSTSSESLQNSPSTSTQTSPSTSPVPRINKNHGFLKHIIRNQIERDEYEKAISQTRVERDQQYQRIRVEQKISQNRYIPPHLRNLASPPSQSQFSPQFPFNDDPQKDPHSELRLRARRSLQREGIL